MRNDLGVRGVRTKFFFKVKKPDKSYQTPFKKYKSPKEREGDRGREFI